MKTFIVLLILVAGAYVGWKYLNKVDIEGSTAKQAEQFDRDVKEQVEGKGGIQNLPPSGQTASEYVAPVARTVEKLKAADAAMQERNAETP